MNQRRRPRAKRIRLSKAQRRAIRRVEKVFEEAAREGKLRPIARRRGKAIGWAGDLDRDDCPCCQFIAREEETPYPGTRPQLCSRCGQVIWLHPEEIHRKKRRLCYHCFMGMRPRKAERPAPVH
jgi:hypothetical protein